VGTPTQSIQIMRAVKLVTFGLFGTLLDGETEAAKAFADADAVQEIARLVPIGCVTAASSRQLLIVQRSLSWPWDFAHASDSLAETPKQSPNPSEEAWDVAVAQVAATLKVAPHDWLHVSASPAHELDPASRRGLRIAYLPRPAGPLGDGGAAAAAQALEPDLVVSDLNVLARQLAEARDGPWRYRVLATLKDASTADEFVRWMRREHGNDLLKAPGCVEYRVHRSSETKVDCEYTFMSRVALDTYLRDGAPRLRARGRELFPEGTATYVRDEMPVVAGRTRRHLLGRLS
jgi:FMN phosphatase YigB (HAD superfamily)